MTTTETLHDLLVVDKYGDIVVRDHFLTVQAAWAAAQRMEDNELAMGIATVESVRTNLVSGARTFKRSGRVRAAEGHTLTREQRRWATADSDFCAAGAEPGFDSSDS
jgi:hypothetical protein